jgi:hypothetical protein
MEPLRQHPPITIGERSQPRHTIRQLVESSLALDGGQRDDARPKLFLPLETGHVGPQHPGSNSGFDQNHNLSPDGFCFGSKTTKSPARKIGAFRSLATTKNAQSLDRHEYNEARGDAPRAEYSEYPGLSGANARCSLDQCSQDIGSANRGDGCPSGCSPIPLTSIMHRT